jgi:hypothetical protein
MCWISIIIYQSDIIIELHMLYEQMSFKTKIIKRKLKIKFKKYIYKQ